MKKIKARDLPQLNARVEPPIKRGVVEVCRKSRLNSQTLVADALRFYFGSQDQDLEMRRALALEAARRIFGENQPFSGLASIN